VEGQQNEPRRRQYIRITIEQDDAEAIASAPLSDHSRNFDPRGNIDWSGLYWNSSNASRDTRPLDGYGLSVRAN